MNTTRVQCMYKETGVQALYNEELKPYVQQSLRFDFRCAYEWIAKLTDSNATEAWDNVHANRPGVMAYRELSDHRRSVARITAAKLLNRLLDPALINPFVRRKYFKAGWYSTPNGNMVKIGARVTIGLHAEFGDGVRIGSGCTIGEYAQIGYGAVIGRGVVIGEHAMIGPEVEIESRAKIGKDAEVLYSSVICRAAEIGECVKIRNEVIIGSCAEVHSGAVIGDSCNIGEYASVKENAKLGIGVYVGSYAKIGAGAVIFDRADIGNYVEIGDGVRISENVELPSRCMIAANTTSEEIHKQFLKTYKEMGDEHIFWKWVHADRTPFSTERPMAKYAKGAIIVAPEGARVSDQRDDIGISVLRPGYRPEWLGMTSPGHNMLCLKVKVRSEDILFAGLPGNDAELRVRKLEVLE